MFGNKPIEPPAPGALRLHRGPDGRTVAAWNGETRVVQAQPCFPWSAPETFISLRDDDGREVALVPDPGALDSDSAAVLRQALREAAFAFEITRVIAVRKEFEIRYWDVVCAEGPRVFQTGVDDWPRTLPPRRLLITDVAGDVYTIADWTALDAHSRKQLAMYTD